MIEGWPADILSRLTDVEEMARVSGGVLKELAARGHAHRSAPHVWTDDAR
jgi:hypothetical protein